MQVSQFQPRNTTTYSEAAEYWKGLASGANFLGRDLRQCLAVIHNDIVEIWNFPSLPMVRRHGPSPISRLIIRFSYLMRVSEGKCPSWSLISPTRKPGLRRMIICKCLWALSYYLFAHFFPNQNSKRDKYCRGSFSDRRHSWEYCEPRWFHRRTNNWRGCVRQVGLRCL